MDESTLGRLREIVGPEYVSTLLEDLVAYSYDGTLLERRPDVVVRPGSAEEVAEVVRLAYEREIPLVPRGMGSGLAGGSIPSRGGIVLTLTRLNRILDIDEANMTATAEAGVVTADLQRAVEAVGLFYPPDPASIRQCTLGGTSPPMPEGPAA